MQNRLLSTSCVVLACLAAPVNADTVIKFTSSQPGMLDQMAIKDGKVLINAPQSQGRMVMDTTAQKMVMFNDKEQKYIEMDEKYMEQTAKVMDQMRQQMMAQLQSMPAEQRAQIEKQMGLANPEAKPPEVTIKPTGQKKTVSGIECQVSDVYTDGAKTMEACMATPQAAKMNADDYATLKRMQEFSKKMMQKSSAMGGAPGAMKDMFPSLDGLPMELKDLQNNFTMTISSVETAALDAKNFAAGSGYQKFDPLQQMQQMQQQRPPAAPAR
ncbi:MAG: DUF4412 domain-containing protein [Thiotrichales bacterium]